MKCKKLFALLLSLCMVLSTFVAVSAQEQVYVEGTGTVATTYVDLENTFEDGMGTAQVGKNAAIAGGLVTIDGRNAVQATYSGTAASSHDSLIAMAVTNPNGSGLRVSDLDPNATLTWSVDLMIPDMTNIQASAGSINLRDGGWTPANYLAGLGSFGTDNMTAGEWKTFSGTLKVSDLNWSGTDSGNTWFCIRPNFKAPADGAPTSVIYVDNMILNIVNSMYADTIVDMNKTMDDAATGVQVPGSLTVDYTTNPGVATVNLTGGTGNGYQAGLVLLDVNGNNLSLEGGDIINWSVKVNSSAAFTCGSSTTGVLLREGSDTNFPMTGSNFAGIASQAVAANTWTTLSGSYTVPTNWSGDSSTKTSLSVRPNVATTLMLDDFVVQVIRPVADEDVVIGGWATPDYSIAHTANVANFGTVSNGVYTFETATIAEKLAQSANNSYTASVSMIPATPVAKDSNWVISYDLTMSGLTDSNGVTNAWIRCVDNTSSAIQGRTVGYVQKSVTVADGTISLEFSSSDLVAGGGTSASNTIAMFNVTFDSSGIVDYTAGATNTGYYQMSNVSLANPEPKLALSAAKGADGKSVDLTIANENAEKYKFSGRLLIAEYTTVDGVPQLVQFAEAAVDNEIAAGGTSTATATFNRAIEGTVSVFVWEPGSLDPIKAFSL